MKLDHQWLRVGVGGLSSKVMLAVNRVRRHGTAKLQYAFLASVVHSEMSRDWRHCRMYLVVECGGTEL